MTRYLLLILILSSFFTGSCGSRKNKLDHKDIIPEEELVSIITEIHLADGLLTIPKINYRFSSLDSLAPYYQVIEKYGYSKETMDKTLQYYLIKKPKKLIQIYDKALGKLSEMESYVDIELLAEQERIRNRWSGREFYLFPDPGGTDSANFSIRLSTSAYYTLKYSATLFPGDQSFNPRFTAYSCNADSIETGKREYYETINYIKDGHPHTYLIVIKVPKNTSIYFRGCLFDMDNHPGVFDKHAIFDNISLSITRAGV
jgi:hypothetical protein